MKRVLSIIFCAVLLAGCAHTTTVPISGNGTCLPSQDLPATKTIKKVPEADTQLEDLWALLAQERKDHATDIRDYNSLFNQCVGDKHATTDR